MSYGIETYNPSGHLTISDATLNYHYVGDATGGSVVWQYSAGYPSFRSYTVSNCPDYPLIFTTGVADYNITSITRVNATTWTVIIACAEITGAVSQQAPGGSGAAPTRVLAFGTKPASPGGWGAEVYDSAGNVLFASGKKPLHPVATLALPVLPASSWNSLAKPTNTYTTQIPLCTTPAWGFCSGARNVKRRATSSRMYNAQFANVNGTTFTQGWQSFVSYATATEMTRSNYSNFLIVIDAAKY